ncbi:unnamed protein product [Hymenolepis diminuta]|uniref:Uncharacterized protein n=1 Tax=Hymenolepis diminuta TaxID=6216 RepID=A0A564Y032_HYMDI|nr:unnamed protein product [Hymenolepis diminuta]
MHSVNRLQPWAFMFICYDYDIRYHKKEDFGQSDGLSPLIHNQRTQNEEAVVAFVSIKRDVQHIVAKSNQMLRCQQRTDERKRREMRLYSKRYSLCSPRSLHFHPKGIYLNFTIGEI